MPKPEHALMMRTPKRDSYGPIAWPERSALLYLLPDGFVIQVDRVDFSQVDPRERVVLKALLVHSLAQLEIAEELRNHGLIDV